MATNPAANDDGTEQQTTPEPDQRVERTDVGASMEVKFKRGTGTRDQDEWRVKGKGATAEEAIDEFKEMLAEVKDDLGDEVRGIQPTEDDDEEGED